MLPRTSTILGTAIVSGASCYLLHFIKNSAIDTTSSTRNPEESVSCSLLGLPTPEEAQASKVQIKKSFLTQEEIQRLVSFAEQMQTENKVGIDSKDGKGTMSASFQSTVWKTSYLHTDGLLEKELPDIQAKIFNGLLSVYREHFHTLDSDKSDPQVNLRTIEYHTYQPGGNLKEYLHYDAGSCITIDIMLEDEFEGGELSFPELDGSKTIVTNKQFQKGDAALFMSHKYHNVHPITTGQRKQGG